MLQAVRVFTVAAVSRPAGRLHVGDIPGLRPQNPQEGSRIEGAGTLFGVVRLLNNAPLFCPVALQGENHILKSHENTSGYAGL